MCPAVDQADVGTYPGVDSYDGRISMFLLILVKISFLSFHNIMLFVVLYMFTK